MSLEKIVKAFSLSILISGTTLLLIGLPLLLWLKSNYILVPIMVVFGASLIVIFIAVVSRGRRRAFILLVPYISALLGVLVVGISLDSGLAEVAKLERLSNSFTENWVNGEVRCSVSRSYNNEGVVLEDCILQDSSVGVLIRLPYGRGTPYMSVCNIQGRFVKPKNTTDFDYVSYLKRKKIFLIANNPIIECEEKNKILGSLLNLRDRAKDIIFKKISEPQASLLVGIIFGEKLSFSESFSSSIKAAGLSHVIAASGFNVSVVVLAIDNLFSFLKPKARSIVILPLIWIYAFLTGFAASMVRACSMTTAAVVAKIFDLKISSETIFFFAVAILILINPLIIFDIGFLLSVCATFGIMFLSPKLERLIKIKWIPYTTISCILTTLPLTLITFNTFSPYAIISNILVLPLIEIVMILGVFGLAFQPLLYICWGALKYMEVVSNAIYSFPSSILTISKPVSVIISIVLILAIISLLFFLKNAKSVKHTN
ncbi:ComEC family competence protein [Candidatus Dojkabacteria bacterium]|jgi:ComEC/Rec2-related protein|nr:ComEC family competence protein [Candidatus Dojkabacteria bacterium]